MADTSEEENDVMSAPNEEEKEEKEEVTDLSDRYVTEACFCILQKACPMLGFLD
jgi:hypothetical protein